MWVLEIDGVDINSPSWHPFLVKFCQEGECFLLVKTVKSKY
jgi:hypothetical protein